MSMRRLSPTANILRNSRLFALPHPLPRPTTADFIASTNFDSETATTAYPTHPAIETTERSLARGDWGLKRPLPLKSTTKTSTPTVRIDNVDSIDYITDFASASDHTRTLDKWREMDMPLSLMMRERAASTIQPPPISSFESDVDNTAISEEESQTRWKFQGPWLAGLEEGEFQDFMKKKVAKRKAEFRTFLRKHLAKAQEATRRRKIQEAGGDLESLQTLEGTDMEVSDAALDLYIKRLREDETTMQEMINEFLDIPRDNRINNASLGRSSYNDKGPPVTHPSGGLSYLRTASHLFNHPLHGPQDDKTPVQARVLAPQSELNRPKRRATLGIGGVITDDSRQPFANGDDLFEVEQFDPDLGGGGKVWVEPKRANLDNLGKIELTTKRAETNAIHVLLKDKGEFREEPRKTEIPPAAVAAARDRTLPNFVSKSEDSGDRGYGLEDFSRLLPQRSKAQGATQDSDKDPVDLLGKLFARGRDSKR